jgi:hypothetical protein
MRLASTLIAMLLVVLSLSSTVLAAEKVRADDACHTSMLCAPAVELTAMSEISPARLLIIAHLSGQEAHDIVETAVSPPRTKIGA